MLIHALILYRLQDIFLHKVTFPISVEGLVRAHGPMGLGDSQSLVLLCLGELFLGGPDRVSRSYIYLLVLSTHHTYVAYYIIYEIRRILIINSLLVRNVNDRILQLAK